MHESLQKIYRNYLNNVPVEVYNDNIGSDVEALRRMMEKIAVARQESQNVTLEY
jgi:hypothetical protein